MSEDRARRLDVARELVIYACRGRSTKRVGSPGLPAISVKVYAVEAQLGLVERHDTVDLRWEGWEGSTVRGVTRVEIREIEDIHAAGDDLGRALFAKIEAHLRKPR